MTLGLGNLWAEHPFRRVVVPAAGSVTVAIDLDLPSATVIRAITSECPCVQADAPLPITLAAPRSSLVLRVSGALPGVKPVTLLTDAGPQRITVQIVSEGLGEGQAILNDVLDRAGPGPLRILVHDLRGSARNCGCSDGSLGGIGRLTRLAALILERIPAADCVLTGDAVGSDPTVAQALELTGWRIGSPAVAVATEMDQLQRLIADPAIAVIIAPPSLRIHHRKVIHPVLDRGMTALVLIGDAAPIVLPVDRSLPDEPMLERRFAGRRIPESPHRPSDTCLPCHASAHRTWLTTAHAKPWAGLPEADRVTGCVECHGIPVTESAAMAGGVHCQSCHQGAEAHATAAGTVRTTGTVACATCHDAGHHPSFDRLRAWLGIAHGRESSAK